jgi:hypothetical protein
MTAPNDKPATRDVGGPAPDLAESLERGEILMFPPGALELPSEEDLAFLRDELGKLISLKNISYHPRGDYLSGIKKAGDARERTRRILSERHRTVTAFLARHLPRYAAEWSEGKVNFRPLQEQGRALSRHSSNELVHVDAFASGATHGDRTLRFFTNIHPTESRVWKSAGLFPELLDEFGPAAGVLPLGSSGLQESALDQLRTGTLRTLAKLGLPQALTVDSSPYDRAMKRMHDTLKDDDAFQRDESRWSFFEFAPFTSWVCFTDMISHACVSGQHALVNTWTVAKASQATPENAPYELIRAR